MEPKCGKGVSKAGRVKTTFLNSIKEMEMDMDSVKGNPGRVIARLLATELTPAEIEAVSGAKGGTTRPNSAQKDTNYS